MAFKIEQYRFSDGSIFEGLSKEDLAFLNSKAIVKNYKAGKLIFGQGSHPKGLYHVKSGKVKIFQSGSQGREQIVYIFTRNESFGYRPILCDEPQPVSAKSLEDTSILFIPRHDFTRLIEQSRTLSNTLLRTLAHEFTVWTSFLSIMGQKGIRERIALCLLILNDKYRSEKDNNAHSEIIMSRDDLASFVGTTKEPLVRSLRYFKDENLIATNGRKISVLNTSRLAKMAEFD